MPTHFQWGGYENIKEALMCLHVNSLYLKIIIVSLFKLFNNNNNNNNNAEKKQ
jgi:hypothetical protein